MHLLVISPFSALAVWFVTVCYVLCPKSIIERKNEYVKFFLVFLSVYYLAIQAICFLLRAVPNHAISGEDPRSLPLALFALGFSPALLLANLVYPFKTVRRSQHLSFFAFLISLLTIGFVGVIWVAHAFSNM